MGPLLRSCVEVRAPIELSFDMVNGVSPDNDVRNGGPRGSRERVDCGVVYPIGPMVPMAKFSRVIRLMREKLRIFPYGQYIVGIYVSLGFQNYTQV